MGDTQTGPFAAWGNPAHQTDPSVELFISELYRQHLAENESVLMSVAVAKQMRDALDRGIREAAGD